MSDVGYRIGGDTVTLRGATVVIDAACEMAEWKAGSRRTAIAIGQRRYLVAAAERSEQGAFRYILEPWPESERTPPETVVTYDPAYVKARNQRPREPELTTPAKAGGLRSLARRFWRLLKGR